MTVRTAAHPASDPPPRTQVISSGDAEAFCQALEQRGFHLCFDGTFAAPSRQPSLVTILHPDRADRDAALGACALGDRGPILFLEPTSSAEGAIGALEAGADDCLVAPHNPREIVARVRALQRRLGTSRRRGGFRIGEARFDPGQRRIVSASGDHVPLTDRQSHLLQALLRHAGRYVSRAHLLDEVLGPDSEAFDRVIDVHVCRLKRKLEQAALGDLIASSRGGGYCLTLPPPA